MSLRKIPHRERAPIVRERSSAIASELAAFVREQRAKNHLGQAELADLAGVGRRFVSDLEGAKPTLRLDAIEAVLLVFGKTLTLKDAPREDIAHEP